ncbi:MAG TPA: hypothetical protein VNR11_14240 [Xanthobacteraceae bacterium]|nr:hypothetical protein [Xanthobacteraceae bacterium]
MREVITAPPPPSTISTVIPRAVNCRRVTAFAGETSIEAAASWAGTEGVPNRATFPSSLERGGDAGQFVCEPAKNGRGDCVAVVGCALIAMIIFPHVVGQWDSSG